MTRSHFSFAALVGLLPTTVLLAILGPRAFAEPVPAPRGDYTTAFVNIGDILRTLMDSDSFLEEREDLIEELRGEEQDLREELDALRIRAESTDPESEQAESVRMEGSQRYEEYRVWQQQAMRRRGTLDAAQLERAYAELVTAVNIVADLDGYDIVYRFIPPEEPFSAESPDQAMMAIRLRTVLRYPDATDITEAVRSEMDL